MGGYSAVHRVGSDLFDAHTRCIMRKLTRCHFELRMFVIREEVFARKIIRSYNSVDRKDIENEARVVVKLCLNKSDHIVMVRRHGWLKSDSSLYFFDMELCTMNLADYILNSSKMSGVTDVEECNGDTVNNITCQIASGLEFRSTET
jgi:hypothetical protein